MFIVYEIGQGKPYADGKKFFRFQSEDRFECEVYVNHHQYDFNRKIMFSIVEE